jgi:hypothetical protein
MVRALAVLAASAWLIGNGGAQSGFERGFTC